MPASRFQSLPLKPKTGGFDFLIDLVNEILFRNAEPLAFTPGRQVLSDIAFRRLFVCRVILDLFTRSIRKSKPPVFGLSGRDWKREAGIKQNRRENE